ncbi:MAG: gfo/Idh/MocA family oxidoreductase, partial [Acidobacteriota bacterium]
MKSSSRREFTKKALATGTVGALKPWRVMGANDRINIALIGCGDRGTAIWKKFLLNPDVNPVAVCDVYEKFLNRAAATAPGLKTYGDFREIIDRKDIDAVV